MNTNLLNRLTALYVPVLLLFCISCSKKNSPMNIPGEEILLERNADSLFADVLQVSFSGNPLSYSASVTVESPDIDCDQYANWWEVISIKGDLIYRRILQHSHANEQPFTRSGGPVMIDEDEVVLIRAHMHPGGYGGKVLKGSIECGFGEVLLEAGIYDDLATEEPLPTDCLY